MLSAARVGSGAASADRAHAESGDSSERPPTIPPFASLTRKRPGWRLGNPAQLKQEPPVAPLPSSMTQHCTQKTHFTSSRSGPEATRASSAATAMQDP
eukprot:13849886-Alexandrium_andersonii.AAC.1